MESVKPPVTILVAISNRILGECLCRVLSDQQTHYSCFSDFNKNQPMPALVLFDPGKNLDLLHRQYPSAKFILMDNGLKEQEISYLLFSHEVAGVIPPDTSMEMLLKALGVVLNGQIWIDNKHLKALLQRNGSMTRNGIIKTLSRQDKRILQLVVQGLKNKEIAAQLCLSEHTIKAHLSRIFKILSVNCRTQLVSLILSDGQSKFLD